MMEVFAWSVLVAILSTLGYYGYRMYDSRMSHVETENAALEQAFEKQMLQELKLDEALPVVSSAGAPPAQAPSDLPNATPPAGLEPTPAAVPNSASPGSATNLTVEEAAKRLVMLGVLTDKQGEIPFPVPPNGLIYAVKQGGMAAILPRLEAEATLIHMCRRFDMVFCLTTGGSIVVVERMETRIASMTSLGG